MQRRSRAREDSDEEERMAREERSRRVWDGAHSHRGLQGGSGSTDKSEGRRSRAQEDSDDEATARSAREVRSRRDSGCGQQEQVPDQDGDSAGSSQEALARSEVQFCFRQNSVSLECKDAVTPESSFRNVSNSRSDHAVRRKCSRRISFADQSVSDRQVDSQRAVAVEYGNTLAEPDFKCLAAGGHIQCGHCCCGCNGRDCDVCIHEIGHKTFLAVNTRAAHANETARPAASVVNNNTSFGFNIVYCRGIFTDDDDDDDDNDETLPPNNVKDSV